VPSSTNDARKTSSNGQLCFGFHLNSPH
jgi:hypothetical protein